MDHDHRDLVRKLFVLMTEILEDTHILASDGQAPQLKPRQYTVLARRIQVEAQNLSAAAGAAIAAARNPR